MYYVGSVGYGAQATEHKVGIPFKDLLTLVKANARQMLSVPFLLGVLA